MNIKSLKIKELFFIALFCFAAIIYGCKSEGGDGETADQENIDSVEVDEDLMEDLNMAKQVFYSLPSPIETAMLMKRAGAKYDESILNPTENRPNYTTNISMALNLGVYSADLSFASMFDQSQATITYITTCKKLAEDLGILNAISKTTIERMETNVNNRDSLMEIISETFMNSNSFLKENDRAETAAIILVGGWVEGLYIATKIARVTDKNDEMIERIIDQRLSLSTLMSLLEQYEDDENIVALMSDLSEFETVYEKVKVKTSKIEAVTDAETNKTTLKATTESSITPELFDELCDKVDKFRTKIVS